MTSNQPFDTLIQSIDQASRQRDVDTTVRAMEAAARKEALGQLRGTTQSLLSTIRGGLKGLEDQRRFTRLRLRNEMRAQLMNLNADVERLRQQVRNTLKALKDQSVTASAAGRQRVAELRAEIGQEAEQRRQKTRGLLDQFYQARAETMGQVRQQLSGYRDGLRQTTAETLNAFRAERARLNAAWQKTRARRAEASAPPVTLVDPKQSLPSALTTLLGTLTQPAADPPVAVAIPVPPKAEKPGSPDRASGPDGKA